MLVMLIQLTKHNFLRLTVTLFFLSTTIGCIPFGYDNSMVDPQSGSKQLVESVSLTIDLTAIAQTKSRKFIPKRGGQYVIGYVFTYKDPTQVRTGFGMPQSLTATIEILDDKGNVLISTPIKHPGKGYSGMRVNLFDTAETGKNKLLTLRVSNLKLAAEDLEHASEIKFYIFQRSNYLWVW